MSTVAISVQAKPAFRCAFQAYARGAVLDLLLPLVAVAMPSSQSTMKVTGVTKPKVAKVKQPKTVKVNGKDYKLPEGWTAKTATSSIMLNLPTMKLDTVFTPTTRIEAYHGEFSQLFGQVLGFRVRLCMSYTGDVNWTENFGKALNKKVDRLVLAEQKKDYVKQIAAEEAKIKKEEIAEEKKIKAKAWKAKKAKKAASKKVNKERKAALRKARKVE